MKFSIIGGSGFIGTNLISLLKESGDIVNIDKNPSAAFGSLTVNGDVRDIETLEKQMSDEDWVVLLAAEHRDDVTPITLYYDVNVEGTKNVISVMEKKNIKRIIFTSTVAIYGLNKDNPTETDKEDPFNHYGKSKWMAEELLREWYNRDPANRTLLIIRPTVVFGPGNKGNVYNLLKQMAIGKFLMIGKGNNKKSMAYVANVVGFMKYFIEMNKQGYFLYNYADKPDLSTKELVKQAEVSQGKTISSLRIPYFAGYMGGMCFDIASRLTGKKFPISAIRVKKFCATTQFSAEKLHSTGYKAPYSLKDGLDETIKSILKDI